MKIRKEQVEVNSSAILKMSYDFENKALTVKFSSNKTYEFKNVQNEIFYAMKHAESIGKYFNKYIRWNYKFNALNG